MTATAHEAFYPYSNRRHAQVSSQLTPLTAGLLAIDGVVGTFIQVFPLTAMIEFDPGKTDRDTVTVSALQKAQQLLGTTMPIRITVRPSIPSGKGARSRNAPLRIARGA